MASPPNTNISLADRTSRGVAWMSIQTLLAKFLGLLTQLLLAKLLLREDFGLYGLAMTVYSFAALLHQAGIQEVLIQRQRSFATWANAGFWISFLTGCLAFLGTVAIAPLAAWFYQYESPRELMQLIAILALNFPVAAAGAVSRARLQIEMRFRALAIIGGVQIVIDSALKVFLAWLGLGAFSFAYATVGAAIALLVMCWMVAPVSLRWNPELKRWKHLLPNGLMVLAAAFFYWLIEQGDYIVLGRFEDVSIVGLYFFAFKISRHTITLLTLQFSKVLFPVLSSLPQDEHKRVQAFVHAARLVALFSIPMCIFQAAIASPLVHLLFTDRWYPTIRLIQIMCVGMALRTISWPAASLMQAQGRFRMRMFLSFVSAVVFILVAILGTWWASAWGLAIAVAAFFSVVALADVALATWPAGHPIRSLVDIYAIPVMASMVAICPALMVTYSLLPRLGVAPSVLYVLQILAVFGVTVIGYALFIRIGSPVLWRECWHRGSTLLPVRLRQLFRGKWKAAADA